MKENKYDGPVFFEKYRVMDRSKKGLSGAGEWHALKKMLPEFKDKRSARPWTRLWPAL